MLLKTITQPDCTIGILTTGSFRCCTLELPWKDNQQNVSCIPSGLYRYTKYDSPSKGEVLLLHNVPDRTYIEIHSGNYTSQIEGCILVGDSIRDINNDGIPDVTNSKNTLKTLLDLLESEGLIQIERL